jgi:hypothetical protein
MSDEEYEELVMSKDRIRGSEEARRSMLLWKNESVTHSSVLRFFGSPAEPMRCVDWRAGSCSFPTGEKEHRVAGECRE